MCQVYPFVTSSETEYGKMLTLCISQHGHVLRVLVWHTPQEVVHFEPVQHPSFALVGIRGTEELPVRIKQACEASDESCHDLVWMEGCTAYDADLLYATVMSCHSAT